MNTDLQALMNTLSCVTYSGDKHTDAQIKETDPSATLRTINISAGNGNWFIFAPDKGRGKSAQMSPLLAVGSKYNHHRACDAVIVALKGQILWLIFIDLKSTSPGGYTSQFQSTRQFARYLLGLFNEFYGVSFTLQERFLLLHTANSKRILLRKKPTRVSFPLSDNPLKPHKELVTDGEKIYLNQLCDSD